MIEVVRAREVPASADDVWAVLADFPGLAEWADNADHSSPLSDPPTGPDAVRRVQAGRWVLVESVTVWEEPTRLAYDIDGMPKVLRHVSNEWRLEPLGPGRCRVSLTTRVDAGPRPPQRLVARIAGRRLAAASDTMLDGLAARVARGGGT